MDESNPQAGSPVGCSTQAGTEGSSDSAESRVNVPIEEEYDEQLSRAVIELYEENWRAQAVQAVLVIIGVAVAAVALRTLGLI